MSVYLSTAYSQRCGNHAAGDANSNPTTVLAILRNRFDPSESVNFRQTMLPVAGAGPLPSSRGSQRFAIHCTLLYRHPMFGSATPVRDKIEPNVAALSLMLSPFYRSIPRSFHECLSRAAGNERRRQSSPYGL